MSGLAHHAGDGESRFRDASVAVYAALAAGAAHRRAKQAPAEIWHTLTGRAAMMQPRESWRGTVDSLALRSLHTDPEVEARYRPSADPHRKLYSLLETARAESLGARRHAGVWKNLAALVHERWTRARPEAVIRNGGADWIETFELLARAPLNAPLPQSALEILRDTWQVWMTPAQVLEVRSLVERRTDQDAFARQSLRVIDAVLGAPAPTTKLMPDDGAGRRHANAAGVAPLPGPSARLRAAHAHGARPAAPAERGSGPSYPAYGILTTAFDATERASDLYDDATLERLRGMLDAHVGGRAADVARWAHRLQRTLLAWQMRSWQFDCDEGILDDSRLTRLVTEPLSGAVYKRESEIRFPATAVTLLLDNSGSMRGTPIATAAACADLLGRVLERSGITTEILGFTTRNWRGGRAAQQWVKAGRPPAPGRIAELRHIIYKTADEPFRRAGRSLGAMLADDILKENVDGEAVLWAHQRLLRRSERRKVLIVISDGAPLDDATFEANDRGYLERHLRAVTADIERRSEVELAAIGINHEVGSYYRRAITLSSVNDLGEALVRQLIALLDTARAP
jgi:cobaltochelatase CobT